MKKLVKLLQDDSGAAAAEYALILAIVGAAIAVAAIGLGGAVSNAMNSSATCISSKGATC
jgi:pilus assembly protein Flp/PilA